LVALPSWLRKTREPPARSIHKLFLAQINCAIVCTTNEATMRGERRRGRREPEKVKITVRGTDSSRTSFEEQTETIDVSAVGLSCYLHTPLFLRTFLSIEIRNSKVLTHIRNIQALVVRIETLSPGKQFVAAQFL
jgi:hypothetical protein